MIHLSEFSTNLSKSKKNLILLFLHFSHIHNRYHRKRDTQKCFNQKEVTRKRDRQTGLNTLKYKIPKVYDMTIEGIQITVLNILLECDLNETPWCDCSGAAAAAQAEDLKQK